MPTEKHLKIISVTGAHSRVGKTTLCSILLKELKGFGAIKFTKTPNSKLQTLNSLVIDNINILNQNGKDTAVFLESGAERVLWIKSPYNRLEDILKATIRKMIGIKGIIIEGNSPVDFISPSLIIFIIGTEGEIKPSAIKVSKKADIIIINSEKQAKRLPFLSAMGRKGKKIFWIDLIKKKGEIDEFLNFIKKRID